MFRPFTFFVSILLLVAGCIPFEVPPPESNYTPVFITRAELENSFEVNAERSQLNFGKFMVYGEYLFVVEPRYGLHVYNYSDVTTFRKVGFMRILGILDVAMKDGILYADNAVDLLAIDMRNPDLPIITQRLSSVFSEPLPPDGGTLPMIANRPNEELILIGYDVQNTDNFGN